MLPNSQFDQELITSSERELIFSPKKKRATDEKEMTQTAGVNSEVLAASTNSENSKNKF